MATTLALLAGVGLTAAPPASSEVQGTLQVSRPTPSLLQVVASADLPNFTEAEELTISATSATEFTVSIVDETSDSGLGRPMLYGSAPGCPTVPQNAPVAQLTCVSSSPPDAALVDFERASAYTQTVIVGSTALVFRGGSGRDDVYGGAGNDDMRGDGGNDHFYGGSGADQLLGGPGDDYLEGEAGFDIMQGGSGTNSIDAADGQADAVDCGGAVPDLLDFDMRLDTVTNCGDDPTPVPPGPVEPVDPPANGEGQALIDGLPAELTTLIGDDTTQLSNDQLILIISTTYNSLLIITLFIILFIKKLQSYSRVDSYLFANDASKSAVARGSGGSAAIPLDSLTADANGNVDAGSLHLPPGLKAGNYTLQFTATLATGAQAIINLGVNVAEDVPGPTPEPTITVASAKRGKGKKATTITVRGSTTELAGAQITPRFQVQGKKGFATAKPVTVSTQGAFTWRLKSAKKTRIFFQAGAVRSSTVTVAAAKRRAGPLPVG